MKDCTQFYINGSWTEPSAQNVVDVINPSTEQAFAKISLGAQADVDLAVGAARKAFTSFSNTSRQERLELLDSIVAAYEKRLPDIAEAVSMEMGAPTKLAQEAQAALGVLHLSTARSVLENYVFEEEVEHGLIRKEPVGVCAMITPWNWPINQISCKVAPALAVGCTMVLKPSEIAPVCGYIFAEVMHDAGCPAGVFNLVNGDGPGVGTALSTHPEIDMVSFTGSTRAGVLVAQNAAPSVKRVTQELGGKSPNILLPDVDLAAAVKRGLVHMFTNSGQSCNAPSRMLVPRDKLAEVEELAAAVSAATVVGPADGENTVIGPVVSETQWNKIQGLIEKGIAEGAKLVCGGPGRPDGLEQGYYVKPTVFSNVTNDMTIAREEIFGPVLTIIPYDSLEEAIAIANDTEYGLSSYVQSSDPEAAKKVAAQIRAGQVIINGANNTNMPFGGYKMSGNGREWGEHGFADYLETKAIACQVA